MVMRDIIEIDDEKCDGCGVCIPNCVEGALQIVNGKARLISDELCDGIGMCLGHCPKDALTVIKRDADDFDEEAVEEYLENKKAVTESRDGESDEVFAHHYQHAGQSPCACPGSQNMILKPKSPDRSHTPVTSPGSSSSPLSRVPQKDVSSSALTHWPIKLHLVHEKAPFLQNADLLVLADCAGVASHDLHADLLRDKAVVIFCPKFEDPDFYNRKLETLVRESGIRSITIAHMEVPCCFGLGQAVKRAVERSGRSIPVEHIIIKRDGKKQKG